MKIIPVIMAGGSGTRLWPLSRTAYPKQFLKLLGDETMLQQTCLRTKVFTEEAPVVICNEEHRFIASEQLRLIGVDEPTLILEPVGRNTAPAIALAAQQILKSNEDAVMVVLSADHHIDSDQLLAEDVLKAADSAAQGAMVTFGVIPTSPETGYGYIKQSKTESGGLYSVEKFVEKPSLNTAKEYLSDGSYLWNSGMFVFTAKSYLKELECQRNDILEACAKSMEKATEDLDFIRPDKAIFLACPEDSIDYAVMEKTCNAKVIPLQSSWNDIGAWSSLWDISEKDLDGNAVSGDVLKINSKNTYVHSQEKLTAILGLDNIVVVDTKDALLVADKRCAQEIKKVVNAIKTSHTPLANTHREVYRPWGVYDSIDNGTRYQVKRITVKPNAKLSVQMHHHRAEHWIVVSGTARVTIGDRTKLIAENESVYIPIGETHCLENPGKIPLELIEVQSGGYLGEDDIVRFEDKYGRS